jgi:hypothetical protein
MKNQSKEPQKPAGKKSIPTKKDDTPKYCYGRESSTICCRCFDLIFSLSYLVLFTVIFFLIWTQCSSVFPEKIAGVEVREQGCSRLGKVPKFIEPISDAFSFWSKRLSKVKFDWVFKLTNALFTGPVALVLCFGFLRGYHWVERIALLHAAITTYSMAVVDGHLYDSIQSPSLPLSPMGPSDSTTAMLVFGYFTLFPVAVICRLWGQQPFKTRTCGTCGCLYSCVSTLLKLGFSSWFLSTFIAFYEFSVKNVSSCKSFPSIMDPTMEMWYYYSADMMGKLEVVMAQLLKYGGELAVSLLALVRQLGEFVIANYNKLFEKGKTAH